MSSNDSLNSFGARDTLKVGDKSYQIYRLDAVPGTEKLPYSLKVLAENLLRTEDGANITSDHIEAIANWDPSAEPSIEIQFTPARVIMQDFTGVPAVVDLAAMRAASARHALRLSVMHVNHGISPNARRWEQSCRKLCERLLGASGDLDLFAEELEASSNRHLGNFPQAFTHLALINAVSHVIADERAGDSAARSHSRQRLNAIRM